MLTVREAVDRLGTNTAASLVTAEGICRGFVPRDDWERSIGRHSLQVASGCRLLAAAAGLPDDFVERAHTAGLVHDIGRFVLFQEAPDILQRIDEGNWATPEDLVDEERSVCGLTHTEIAAHACDRWGLPTAITLVTALHHEPRLPSKLPDDVRALIRLIRFVDIALFPSALPGAAPDRLDVRTIEIQIAPLLPTFISLDPMALQHVARGALAEAERIAESIGI